MLEELSVGIITDNEDFDPEYWFNVLMIKSNFYEIDNTSDEITVSFYQI